MTEEFQNKKEITADEFSQLIWNAVKETEDLEKKQNKDPSGTDCFSLIKTFFTPTVFVNKGDTRLVVKEQADFKKLFDILSTRRTGKQKDFYFENIEFSYQVSIPDRPVGIINKILFSNCTFASFSRQHSYPQLSIEFENCQIHKIMGPELKSNVEFKKCDIGDIEIGQGNLIETNAHWEFQETSFGGDISVNGIKFINLKFLGSIKFFDCIFYRAPNFSGCQFNHQSVFSQCYFRNFSQNSIAPYRLLRSEMQRLGNEREAVMFGSMEMDAYHQAEFQGKKISGSDRVEKWASTLYRGFSSYGRDVLTPFLWITLVSTFLFYGVYDVFDLTVVDIKSTSPEWVSNFFQDDRRIPLIQSFWNMLGPISLLIDSEVIQPRNGWGASAFIIQKTLASIMWFLWILQIRRRFKLG